LEQLGAAAAQLKSPIDLVVVRPMGTSIFQLRATGTDPALTQAFLQALIDKYLAFKRDTRVATAEDLVASLNDQLTKREDELKTEQEKWLEFQKTNAMAVLEEEAKSSGIYLANLHGQLDELKLKEELLRNGVSPSLSSAKPGTNSSVLSTNLASISTDSTGVSTNTPADTAGISMASVMPGGAAESAVAMSDALLNSTRIELALAMAKKAKLLSQYSEGHPALRSVNEDVERLTNSVVILEQQNKQQIAQQKRLELDDVEKRIAAIEKTVPVVEQEVLEVNNRLSESQRNKNGLQLKQSRFDSLLATLQNVDLGKNMAQEKITVLEPPSPSRPTERYLPLRIFLAVVGGLSLGLAAVFGWHLLDDRFVSVRDVKDNFGETVLGLVPEIKVPRTQPREALLKESDPRRPYAESFRHLRSALLLSALGGTRPHTLLFTGAGPTEGKSTIAANIARVLARSGLRVVLLDADTHAGTLGHLLEAEGKPGVLDFLRGEVAASAITHQTDMPGLTLVPAGTHAEHAEGLFLRPQLGVLMNELKAGCDFVIIDAPPILGSDNTSLLVPYADTVVTVVRPFFSRARLVRQSLEMLYQRQAKQVAIILNRARKDDLAGHYAQNGLFEGNNKS
jgi:Mrp family chromosome partitioning ATPase